MDTDYLEDSGLTEGEAKTYLALLELGSSTTGDIVQQAEVSKSIIYQILDKLMDKGLASYIVENNTKHYQAANPKKIVEYVERQQAELQDTKDELKNKIPELMRKRETNTQSEARIYTGLRGIRTAHEHVYDKLAQGETFHYLGVPAYQPEEQHRYWKQDHQRRIQEGIKCKLLFNRDADKEVVRDRDSYDGSEARYMPTDIETPATFLIYKNVTTIILQHPTEIAVEIINQDIADSFQAYFNAFWNQHTRVYHGKEGAARVLCEVLEAGKEGKPHLGYGTDYDPYVKHLPDKLDDYIQQSQNIEFEQRLIFARGFESPNTAANVRYLGHDYLSPVRIMIYGNNVAMVDFTEPITTIIIDKEEVADAYKKHFEFLWKRADEEP